MNVRSDLGIASLGRFAWAWGGLLLRRFLCSSTHRKERTFLVISLFTAMDDTSASAFSTAMDDTSASAFSTAMDDTSASVFMTWTTSARFTDAPVPKVIALTAARYQPHPSFRTALARFRTRAIQPSRLNNRPTVSGSPAANAHASTPPPNPL